MLCMYKSHNVCNCPFRYGNAVTADLWHQLSKVSPEGLNITRIMDTWTRQMGFPYLTVIAQGYYRNLGTLIHTAVVF